VTGSTTDSDILLRPATVADAPALAALAQEAFIAAFAHLYRPEDLDHFLTTERSEPHYRVKLADPATRTELAFVDGRLAAYCLIAWGTEYDERPEPRPARPMFLSQLYCAGGMTGLGLGATLMDWAFAQAREGSADAIQLSVYSENFGAQRFYQRYGFEKVADIGYWVGEQRDDEFLYEVGLK
jgi:ribosomal protein S18 acetylase RimI-like enzyme